MLLPCFKTSTIRAPCARRCLSVSHPGQNRTVRSSAALYTGEYTSFKVPATFFIALICALPPTRDTEIPGFTAGMIPEWNSSVSRKICPSVMEITLVGMYADTSPACVSMIGRAVREPPPFSSEALLHAPVNGSADRIRHQDKLHGPVDGGSEGKVHGMQPHAYLSHHR